MHAEPTALQARDVPTHWRANLQARQAKAHNLGQSRDHALPPPLPGDIPFRPPRFCSQFTYRQSQTGLRKSFFEQCCFLQHGPVQNIKIGIVLFGSLGLKIGKKLRKCRCKEDCE
jgi:hypothetical protein